MTDSVGFGEKTSKIKEAIPSYLQDVKKILEAGVEASGDEVLNEWEERFVASNLDQLKRLGAKWDYSDARRDVVEKIEAKLKREGLLA